MFFTFTISTFSQSKTITLQNKTYFEEEDKWYTTDQITNEKFEVNERSMTVKLKNEQDKPKGVYFYTLNVNGFTKTGKLIISK